MFEKFRIAVLDGIQSKEKRKKALKEAVNQIKEKEYISYVKNRGYNNIIAFGLVFDGKKCWVKEV